MERAQALSEPIRVFALLKRRADLDMAAFSQHWRTKHAVAALKLTKFFDRNVQNHFAEEPLPGFGRFFDGAAELWYQNWSRCVGLVQSEEYRSDAHLDGFEFQDMDAGRMLVTRVIGTSPGLDRRAPACAVKVAVFWQRREGLSPESFREHFATRATPLLLRDGRYSGFERCIALPKPGEAVPLFDAAEELWWSNEADFLRDLQSLRRAGQDEPLVDRGSSMGVRVEDVYVYWP